MPEFILNHGTPEAAKRFCDLDGFTRGYIECMFFTDASNSDDGDLADATFDDISQELLTSIKEDCSAFNLMADAWLHRAYLRDDMSYTMERAGHDFWLTRNGHGAGFWDRGLGGTGRKLTEFAKTFGTVTIYRGDDGLIYA